MPKAALFFLIPSSLFGAYTYYYSEPAANPANWTINGDSTFTSSGGGSQISSLPVPDGTSDYEVRTTLSIKASGGTFITYLRASTDALNGPNAAGTYYAFEL